MGSIPPVFAYLLARSEDFRTFAIQQMTGSSGRQRVTIDCFDKYNITTPDINSLIFEHFRNLFSPIFDRTTESMTQWRILVAIRTRCYLS